jgi:hypothetical protein
MKRQSAAFHSHANRMNNSSWWAYNNRGMAIEDLEIRHADVDDLIKALEDNPELPRQLFRRAPLDTKLSRLKSGLFDLAEQLKLAIHAAKGH